MFGLEPWHIVLLLAVVLVVFGPKRLPEIGRNLGESIREFRKATTEFGDSVRAGAAPSTNNATVPMPPPATAPVEARAASPYPTVVEADTAQPTPSPARETATAPTGDVSAAGRG